MPFPPIVRGEYFIYIDGCLASRSYVAAASTCFGLLGALLANCFFLGLDGLSADQLPSLQPGA